MIRNLLSVGAIVSAIVLTACSGNSEKTTENFPEEESFSFSSIESLIEQNKLEQALNEANNVSELNREDSLALIEYIEFIDVIVSLQSQLKQEDQQPFIDAVLIASRGNYKGDILGSGANDMYSYSKSFAYGWITLSKQPFELKLRSSYEDKDKGYYHHIVTDVSVVSGDSKIHLGHGFGVNGETKSRPLDFDISKKTGVFKKILSNEVVKVIYTTAKTYNDRAYHSSTIWDVKAGEAIKYNDVSVFKERKTQIIDKGEVKTFEIELNKEAKEQISNLIKVNEILTRNNVKSIQ